MILQIFELLIPHQNNFYKYVTPTGFDIYC